MSAKIINLYVTSPDVTTPGRTRTYTVSAGEMTLVAELADSETGEVIARVRGHRKGRGSVRSAQYRTLHDVEQRQ